MRIALRCAASVFGLREMRAGDEDRPRRRDEGLVDVVLAQRHVGAVLAVEDQRKRLVVLDREDHERRQPLGSVTTPSRRDALALQLLADEAAHLLVADAGDQRRVQAEPRGADGDVGRAAADGFGEAADVLEPRADLLAVEVDRRRGRW